MPSPALERLQNSVLPLEVWCLTSENDTPGVPFSNAFSFGTSCRPRGCSMSFRGSREFSIGRNSKRSKACQNNIFVLDKHDALSRYSVIHAFWAKQKKSWWPHIPGGASVPVLFRGPHWLQAHCFVPNFLDSFRTQRRALLVECLRDVAPRIAPWEEDRSWKIRQRTRRRLSFYEESYLHHHLNLSRIHLHMTNACAHLLRKFFNSCATCKLVVCTCTDTNCNEHSATIGARAFSCVQEAHGCLKFCQSAVINFSYNKIAKRSPTTGHVRIRHKFTRFWVAVQSFCGSRWVHGKPKWLPLKFGYRDVMRTSPIWTVGLL